MHRARFLITAIGPLSAPTMPRIEGVDSFKGQSFHTARWPHAPVSFAGKRVAVIGTGATGVQTIAEVAKTVGHLTVFQRTPNWCKPLHNGPIDAETQARIKASYPEMFRRCQETSACFIHTVRPARHVRGDGAGARGVPREAIRDARLRHVAGQLPRHADQPRGERGRQRVRGAQDPRAREGPEGRRQADPQGPRLRHPPRADGDQVLRGLQPAQRRCWWTSRRRRSSASRRRASRPATPSYEFDIIIYATGFDAITGSFDRIDIRGARRAEAEGQVGGRAADLPRRPGRGLPQHVHADGAAHRARQHPPQHRVQRRMGDGPASATCASAI